MAKKTLDWVTTPRQGVVTWGTEPTREERGAVMSAVHSWTSACGNYKLVRIDGGGRAAVRYAASVRRGDSWNESVAHWDLVESDRSMGSSYPLYHDSLEKALAGMEKATGLTSSNREELLKDATDRGLAGQEVLPREDPPVKKKRDRKQPSVEDRVLSLLTDTPRPWQDVCREAGLEGKGLILFMKLVREGRMVKQSGGVRKGSRKIQGKSLTPPTPPV